MSPRIPTTTALLVAAGAALPLARADLATTAARDRVAFEDSSRTSAPPAAPLPALDRPAPPAPRAAATPRLELALGPYTSTRTLAFDVSSGTAIGDLPATSPESTLIGAQVAAALFPAGGRDDRGRLVGPGITASYRHSLGATATFDDEVADELLELPVVDSAWSIGLRYRQPLGPVLLDVGAAHQSASHRVDERPDWLELPDADYRSIAVSARAEAMVRGRATIALGGGYHYVLDAGELMSDAGYGPGTISAYDLTAAVDLPVARGLFAHAGLGYHHVAMTFSGGGDLGFLPDADIPDVYGAIDRSVDAELTIGVRY
ncbi:MAG: hypothetical protein IPL61_03215 [Myxococcales bacterium]|nr:hypothetical protein [Myxococcales bacterium]